MNLKSPEALSKLKTEAVIHTSGLARSCYMSLGSGECNVTQCYRCHEYGHVAKHCRNIEICGRYASATHTTRDCSDREAKRYTTYTKRKKTPFNHAAWDPTYPIRINRIARTKTAYTQRPQRYQEPKIRNPPSNPDSTGSTQTSSQPTSSNSISRKRKSSVSGVRSDIKID